MMRHISMERSCFPDACAYCLSEFIVALHVVEATVPINPKS